MKRTIRMAAAALALMAAPVAFAGDDDDAGEFGGIDYNVSLNGGVGGYLGQLSDFTGVGPTWALIADGDLTQGIGWEIGYQGSHTPVTDGRLEGDPAMWRHGADALAKVYLPDTKLFRPFAGIGLGGSYMNANEDAEPLYRNDFVAEVPVAAGLDINTAFGIRAGVRATYRFMAGEEFAENAFAGESPEGGLLSTQLTVGGNF